jgi:hypothetical protein
MLDERLADDAAGDNLKHVFDLLLLALLSVLLLRVLRTRRVHCLFGCLSGNIKTTRSRQIIVCRVVSIFFGNARDIADFALGLY